MHRLRGASGGRGSGSQDHLCFPLEHETSLSLGLPVYESAERDENVDGLAAVHVQQSGLGDWVDGVVTGDSGFVGGERGARVCPAGSPGAGLEGVGGHPLDLLIVAIHVWSVENVESSEEPQELLKLYPHVYLLRQGLIRLTHSIDVNAHSLSDPVLGALALPHLLEQADQQRLLHHLLLGALPGPGKGGLQPYEAGLLGGSGRGEPVIERVFFPVSVARVPGELLSRVGGRGLGGLEGSVSHLDELKRVRLVRRDQVASHEGRGFCVFLHLERADTFTAGLVGGEEETGGGVLGLAPWVQFRKLLQLLQLVRDVSSLLLALRAHPRGGLLAVALSRALGSGLSLHGGPRGVGLYP